MRPKLSAVNGRVFEVWNFCDGWQPALVPLAMAYHGLSDIDFVLWQLMVIRDFQAGRFDDMDPQ
jgi:hypothetical protein